MKSMTSRERILSVFARQTPDRIPWAPVIDGYYTSYLEKLGKPMNVVETLRFIGADIIERHVPACQVKYHDQVQFSTVRRGNETVYRFETPVGNIEKLTRWSGQTESIIKHYLETVEDIKTLQFIEEHKEYIPDYESFVREDQIIGDSGIATVSASSTPLANLYEFYMGLEGFVFGLYDYPEEMSSLMELMHYNNKLEHHILAGSPTKAVFIYEDTSTTTISRELYLKYCQKQLNEYAEIIHKAGKYYFTHMCGKLKGFSDLIAVNEMDGIDSLCPPATGDLWPNEALSVWSDKIIIGGLDPSKLQQVAVSEVEDDVRKILHQVKFGANGDRFILSTGDATAYGTPLENLLTVAKVVSSFSL